MGIQKYVTGSEFKKLISDKMISTAGLKSALGMRGILPVCTSVEDLSDLVFRFFLGSEFMTQLHDEMNLEQSNLKSTVVILRPQEKSSNEPFLQSLTDELLKSQRISHTKYILKNISRTEAAINLEYCYFKPQKGRVSLAEEREVSLHVEISKISSAEYKVNIRHEGLSESKPFISFLEDMTSRLEEDTIFKLKRVSLSNLVTQNKVDFFDRLGSYVHKDWQLEDITNITVNQNLATIDADDTDNDKTLTENESSGKLTGIKSAILSGAGLRNNEFVKDCMAQDFIFSSMRYKLRHKSSPSAVEVEVTFKQIDIKVNITKMYTTQDDERDAIDTWPEYEQSSFIDYFQNICYEVYSSLLNSQKQNVTKL